MYMGDLCERLGTEEPFIHTNKRNIIYPPLNYRLVGFWLERIGNFLYQPLKLSQAIRCF
jgi:hypothetical protein